MKISKSTIVLDFLTISTALAKTHSAGTTPLILTRLPDTLSVKIHIAQRAVVRFFPLKRLTPKVIQAQLMSVDGPDAFTRTTVKKGHKHFTKGEGIFVMLLSQERI
jgi:hypothetical protein